jgi:hypothetical protein
MESSDTDANKALFSQLMDQLFSDPQAVPDVEAFKTRLAARLMERRTATMVKHALGRLDPTPHTNHVEGIGQAMMDVDMDEFLWWDMKFPGCWHDAQFRKEYARDNPAARAIYDRMKTTIVMPETSLVA